MIIRAAHSLCLALGSLLLFAADMAAARSFASPYSEVALISEAKGVVPGETAWLGLHIKTRPGWYTYWRNPGDSGLPAEIEWSLPKGVSAGEIQWPVPQKITTGPVTNFGYKNEILLMVPVSVDRGAGTDDEVALTAEASWLVCGEICVPERARFSLALPVVDKIAEPTAELFSTTRGALPAAPPIQARGSQTADRITITVDAPARNWGPTDEIALFAATEGAVALAAPQNITIENRKLVIELAPGYVAEQKKLTKLDGVLVTRSVVDGKIRRKGVKLTATFDPGS